MLIFTFKNLYENFYTKKTYIGAIILILCIMGILYSYKGARMSNDLVMPLPYIKARYNVNDIIKADLVALVNMGVAFVVIRRNKKNEKMEREKYLGQEKRDSERFFSALRNKDSKFKQ